MLIGLVLCVEAAFNAFLPLRHRQSGFTLLGDGEAVRERAPGRRIDEYLAEWSARGED